MYGKLENGILQYAPKSVIFGNKRIINPSEETLLSLGYLPVADTEPPKAETGTHAVGRWEQTETEIVRVWTVEADEPAEPTLEEQIAELRDELYSAKILLGLEE